MQCVIKFQGSPSREGNLEPLLKKQRRCVIPNHVTNRLAITGKGAAKVFQAIKGKKQDGEEWIDFNKILPLPKELRDVESSGEEYEVTELLKKIDPKHLQTEEAFKDYLESNVDFVMKLTKKKKNLLPYLWCFIKYGVTSWYPWCNKYWGTKWNAYSQDRIDKTTIQFDTAWSTPYPLMELLSKQFPEVTITVEFADEDLGNNCGRYAFKNGEEIERWTPERTDHEDLLFAATVKGYDPQEILREYYQDEQEND